MKLLVVSEFPPNASGGGPAVVRQMLRNWPVDKLCWWSCTPDIDQQFRQGAAAHYVATLPAKLYPQKRFTQAKSWLLDQVWSPWAAAHLKHTLEECEPDVIWAIPHNWAVPPLFAVLPGQGIGFHVSVHDFVDVHGMPEKLGSKRCAAMVAKVEQLYAASSTCDVISPSMGAELKKRTGRLASEVIRAGIEREDFAFLEQKRSSNLQTTIRIAYAGSILVEDEFALFASALKLLRVQLGRRVELHLFGAHTFRDKPWFDPDWMCERGNLPAEELTDELRRCDWGFSPMALGGGNDRYNRFSFPTKFISYIAAGLPVITLGHPESSVMQMAKKYKVGVATAESDRATLSRTLLAALEGASAWQEYGAEILRCAREEFDAERMRRRLYSCFNRCAAAERSPEGVQTLS